jgi:hypothetical protein
LAGFPPHSPWCRRLKVLISASEDAIGVHVAVFVEPYLSALLDGRKTMESRFTLTRQPPYYSIEEGDLILLKRSGGPVVGIAEAGTIQSYTLSPKVVQNLRDDFADRLCAWDENFWSACKEKNYATLIEIKDRVEMDPVTIPKRDRRGWVSYKRRLDSLDFQVA